jgi:hypothetical protein
MSMTERQWHKLFRQLETKAAEVLKLIEDVPKSDNESDLATLIDINVELRSRMLTAVRTIEDRGS